jgi:hypothetical protein
MVVMPFFFKILLVLIILEGMIITKYISKSNYESITKDQ